jgi:hypothetical protein
MVQRVADAVPATSATASGTAPGARQGLAEAMASGPVAPPATPGGAGGGLAASPAADPTTAAFVHSVPAAAPAPGGAGHSATVDALTQVATDPRLLAATGITALAGTAYVAARGAGCVAGNDAGVILNNVRLIPCLARSGVSSGGAALASVGTGVRQAAGAAAGATRQGIGVLDERLSKAADDARRQLAERVAEPFLDGLGRAVGEPPGDSGGRGGDLFFVGIGVVVGLLYAAILTLWLAIGGARRGTSA